MKLRILTALRTSYAPAAKSGADVMCERINTYLASKGHEVMTIIEDCPQEYTYKGVRVTSNRELLGEKYDWCDIVITNLVVKGEAVLLAKRFNKPIFHIVHNANGCNVPAGTSDNYLIFNSLHLQKSCNYGLPSIVVNPPTWIGDWENSINHYSAPYVTLVNCVQNKGHETLCQLATYMPGMQFMGVYGGYGQQGRKSIRNLRYMPFQPDMREIYNQTRIIIVPSITESWSLVAAEAQASGIPVICSGLPGLYENLGITGIYSSNLRGYMDAINRLGDYGVYLSIIELGKKRQIENERTITQQLENLNTFMEKVNYEKRGVTEITKVDLTEVSLMPDGSFEAGYEIKEKVEHTTTEPEKKIINKPGRPVKIK
jgi:glycosyltransferase involved in cell wall biosynthesis